MKKKTSLKGAATETVTKEVAKSVLPKVIIGGMAIGAAYLLLLKPILIKVGVIKTKEQEANEKATQNNNTSTTSAFSPQYYKNAGAGASLITKAVAQQYAQQIHDAIGNFYDDENKVYGVFRQLKSKTQVSWLADVFYQMFKEDLYNYLSRNLNESELAVVNGIVNGLALNGLGFAGWVPQNTMDVPHKVLSSKILY